MKKIVFLFALSITVILNLTNGVYGVEIVYEIDDYEIIVDRFKVDGITGFTVEKTGVNPFMATVIDDLEHYLITGVTKLEDYYILYGYGFIEGSGNEYDSLFIVFDQAGNVIKKDLRDYGSMDVIKEVYLIDNIFITYNQIINEVGYSYEFESNFFTTYDLNFNYINSIEIGSKIERIDSNEQYILIGYDYYSDYNLAIRSDLTTLEDDAELDLYEGEVFYDSVSIEFLNSATLNNDYIENGVSINYPGDYTLIYNNKIYNFVVTPTITGVIDNYVYTESVKPVIKSGNVMLNNDLFISNTEIDSPGIYELIITGANNYSNTVSFTITSNIEGIINNNSYVDYVTFSFNGEGYLNNQYIESPYEVTESGEYILKIRGENNYLETYFFTVEESTTETSFIDFVQRVDILVLVVVLISGGIILKKK